MLALGAAIRRGAVHHLACRSCRCSTFELFSGFAVLVATPTARALARILACSAVECIHHVCGHHRFYCFYVTPFSVEYVSAVLSGLIFIMYPHILLPFHPVDQDVVVIVVSEGVDLSWSFAVGVINLEELAVVN